MMENKNTNKPTRRSRNVTISVTDRCMDEAHYLMQELQIPTFSALVRELVNEMYCYLISEDWKKRNEAENE